MSPAYICRFLSQKYLSLKHGVRKCFSKADNVSWSKHASDNVLAAVASENVDGVLSGRSDVVVRVQLRHRPSHPVPVGRHLFRVERRVPADGCRRMSRVVRRAVVQKPLAVDRPHAQRRSARSVLGHDARGTPAARAVPRARRRRVPGHRAVRSPVPAVAAVQQRCQAAGAGLLRNDVRSKHEHVLRRNPLCVAVLRTVRNVFESQPGPGASRRGGRSGPDGDSRLSW